MCFNAGAEGDRRFPSFGFLCVGDNKDKQSIVEHGKLSPLTRLAESTPRRAAHIGRLACCHHVSTQQGSRSPAERHKEEALLSAQHPSLFLLHTQTHRFLLEIQERSCSKT